MIKSDLTQTGGLSSYAILELSNAIPALEAMSEATGPFLM